MDSRTHMGAMRPNSSAITTPEVQHPTTKHASLLKLRLLGAALVLVSLAFLYWSMWRPLTRATRTGSHVWIDLRSITLFYLGIMLLVADLRDATITEIAPDGRRHLNRKGRIARLC